MEVIGCLTHVGIRISSYFSDSLIQEFQIGLNDWRILSSLAKNKELSIRNICSMAGIHKTVASRSIQKLSDRGMVVVNRKNRYLRVEINDLGRRLYDSILPSIKNKQDEILDPLDQKERNELDWLLSKIQRALNQN